MRTCSRQLVRMACFAGAYFPVEQLPDRHIKSIGDFDCQQGVSFAKPT